MLRPGNERTARQALKWTANGQRGKTRECMEKICIEKRKQQASNTTRGIWRQQPKIDLDRDGFTL